MKKTVCLGDFLVSLSTPGYLRFQQAASFDVFYTGAEANVAASLAQFGLPTEFVTRLPDNAVAKSGIAELNKYGIITDHIAIGGNRIGVLYMERGAAQRPSSVIYDRHNSSVCEMKVQDFDFDSIFENCDWFHFTGITPALSDSAAEVCLAACKSAVSKGITISCDLNYRKKLWSTEKAKSVMEKLLPYVDVLIANEEDVEKVLGLTAGKTDVEAGTLDHEGYVSVARQLIEKYQLKYVATTLRESKSASDNGWSAMICDADNYFISKRYDIHIVNRVGAGDSFSGGLIYSLKVGKDLQSAIDFAAAASCLKHSIEFDFNLVTKEEVESLAAGHGSGRVQR